jgi:O-acetylserine/cysteine efflux transporter
MPLRDLLLALVVVVVWGINFVIAKVGLQGVPPMLLGGLRFVLVVTPAVFFVKRPAVPWRWLLAYGGTIFLGQFAFLYSAMTVGMPAGLASLVLQAQVFFTLMLAALFLHERLRIFNAAGLLIAAGGLALIGMQGDRTMTLAGFALTLCAALSWGLGNIVTKKIGKVDLVGLIVWGSLVPPIPFFALSWWLEGPQRIEAALLHIGLAPVLAVIYLAVGSTLIGYGLWGRLLSHYPASQVAPFSLLVPVVGLASAAGFMGERLSAMQWLGVGLVMAGLAVNVFGGQIRSRLAKVLD